MRPSNWFARVIAADRFSAAVRSGLAAPTSATDTDTATTATTTPARARRITADTTPHAHICHGFGTAPLMSETPLANVRVDPP